MMDQQVFVFGSFTEDEALQFNARKPQVPVPSKMPVKAASVRSEGLKSNGHVVVPEQATTSSSKEAAKEAPKGIVSEFNRVSLNSEKKVVVEAAPEPTKKSWADRVGVQHEAPTLARKIVRTAEATATTRAAKGDDRAPKQSFLPRGLVNTGNTCFLNSTLQALLSCSPFCELLKRLKSQKISQEDFPLLHAFALFAGELENESQSSTEEKYYRKGEDEVKLSVKDVEIGKALTPSMFDPILLTFSPETATVSPSKRSDSFSGPKQRKNRQEDAQEFLSFMMNQMHDELIKLDGRGKQATLNVADGGEWETVGPKNKTAVTRTYSLSESPLSEIFGGQQHSVVRVKGVKPSATVEPFYLLHLDISSENVLSVEDALRHYVALTPLEGYKSPTGKTEEASKSMKISSLPKVLILHLMRFSYGAKGTGKLHKPIRYPPQLALARELLTSPYEARNYELVATITHHGKEPSGGHYTADTKLSTGVWLRFDDRVVSRVGLNTVLHDQAYILFYRRLQ